MDSLFFEIMSTINVVGIFYVFRLPLVLLLGAALLVFFIGWRFFNFKKIFGFNQRAFALSFLLVLWLPFVVQPWAVGAGLYQEAQDVSDLGTEGQSAARLCNMQVNQDLPPHLCYFMTDLPDIKNQIPKNSKLYVDALSTVDIYASYYLLDDYRLANDWKEAEYALIYFTQTNYSFDESGNIHLVDQGNLKKKVSSFEKFYYLGDERVIFKLN